MSNTLKNAIAALSCLVAGGILIYGLGYRRPVGYFVGVITFVITRTALGEPEK
jgi:hypothetical protein